MSPSSQAVCPDGDYQTFDFNDNPIQLIPHEGDFWVTGEAIGGALGYPDARVAITKMYNRNQEELKNYSCNTKLVSHDDDGTARRRSVRVYNIDRALKRNR